MATSSNTNGGAGEDQLPSSPVTSRSQGSWANDDGSEKVEAGMGKTSSGAATMAHAPTAPAALAAPAAVPKKRSSSLFGSLGASRAQSGVTQDAGRVLKATFCTLEDDMGGAISVGAGASCGYMLRQFTMLNKHEVLFYIVDSRGHRLIELDHQPEQAMGQTAEVRSYFSLNNARLEDKLSETKVGAQTLYYWKLFVRGEASSKTVTLGSHDVELARKWITALRGATGGDGNRDDTPNEPVQGSGVSVNASSTASDPEPSSMGPGSLGWHQEVKVNGKTFRIPCSEVSTNAWLLSEAIRMYMRKAEGDAPDVTGIYNLTQHSLIDLGDDVIASVAVGDVLEAITGAPQPTSPKATSPRSGLRHSKRRQSISESILDHDPAESDDREVTDSLVPLNHIVNAAKFEELFETSGAFVFDRPSVAKSILLSQLDVLCKGLTVSFPYWPTEYWKSADIKHGVHIFKSSDGKSSSALGMVTVKQPPSTVLEYILDVRSHVDWNPYLGKAKYLEVAPNSDVVYMATKNTLQRRAACPWLLSRDFCVARLWEEFSDGTIVLLMSPSAHPLCPSTNAGAGFLPFVRGKMAGAFALRPLKNDTCLVIQLSSVNVDAAVGGSWCNQRVQSELVSCLAGLREACAF